MTRRYTGGFLSANEQATDANSANGVYTLSEVSAKLATGSFPTGRFAPQRSIRFRGAASAYMGRTPSVAGSRTTWTWSGWIKRGKVDSSAYMLFTSGTSGSNDCCIFLETTGSITFFNRGGFSLATNALFRDPSAWYHIVATIDTTNTVATERARLYVNGVRINSFSTQTNPTLNETPIINSTNAMYLGTRSDGYYYDGYMSEVNFIDGQSLDPSNFGLNDSQTGAWIPKRYTGTYGTNGFYQNYTDATAGNTAGSNAGVGKDLSGNGNYFNTNAFSSTAGATYDAMVDVPGIVGVSSLPDIGGVQRGNYCTMNPLSRWDGTYSAAVYSNANLQLSLYDNGVANGTTAVSSGKWYWEVTCGSGTAFFIGANRNASTDNYTYGFQVSGSLFYFSDNGSRYMNGDGGTYPWGSSYATGDVIGCALDLDNNQMTWYKNNVPQPTTAITPGIYTPAVAQGGASSAYTFNFGSRPFTYTPPVGFKSLNTTNLPNPVIKRPKEHFDVKLWTGNGTDQIIGTSNKQTPAYSIAKSARFRSSNYLHRNFPTAGSRTTWTWAGWFKRGTLGSRQVLFGCQTGADNNSNTFVEFNANDKIAIDAHDLLWRETTDTFRDTTQWHHIAVSVDTTKANANDRIRLYVDGKLINTWATFNSPSQNANLAINSAALHTVGSVGTTINNDAQILFFDGSLADVHFIDGQQLASTSFGTFDANNNWIPQRYTGTYGTNGYNLKFNGNNSSGTQTYGAFVNNANTAIQTSVNATIAALGTGNFTVEFWYNRIYSSSQDQQIFDLGTTGFSILWDDAANCFSAFNRTTSTILTGSTVYTGDVDTVYHLALVRNSGATTLYVNGIAAATHATSFNSNFTSTTATIGCRYAASGGNWYNAAGVISNLRITTTAVYTSNFDVPTSPLTAIANTNLLTCQSSTFVDNSGNGRSITTTNVGSPAYCYPFVSSTENGTSWATYFNTSGSTAQYLLTPATSASNAVELGSSDFTIEFWWHPTSTSRQALYHGSFGTDWSVGIDYNGTGTPSIGIWASTNGTNWNLINADGGGNGVGSIKVRQSQWNHIAFVRSGTTWMSFINGVRDVNLTGLSGTIVSRPNSSKAVGAWWNTTAMNTASGWINNFRITKSALYTSNFAPPVSDLTAIANTQLLTCQSSRHVDDSANALTITQTGNLSTMPSAPFASTMGRDSSSNNNHMSGQSFVMAPYAMSSYYDSMTDTPSDISSSTSTEFGGVTTAGYATLDANSGSGGSYLRGNLAFTSPAVDQRLALSTLNMFGTGGKFYCEVQIGSKTATFWQLGVFGNATTWNPRLQYRSDGACWIDGTQQSASFASYGINDIIGMAFDATTETVTFYKNGLLQGSLAYVGTTTAGVWKFGVGSDGSGGVNNYSINFGQLPFMFQVPSGYKALSVKTLKELGSYNLPDVYGNYVNTPDLVWMKARSVANWNFLYDTVRGPGYRIMSNTQYGQSYEATTLTKFLPNGFQVSTDPVSGVNVSGTTHVGWNWNRGQVPGFDIINWSGNGTAREIQHNLGQQPKFMLIRTLNPTGASNFTCYHENMNAGNGDPTTGYLNLNLTGGFSEETAGSSRTRWWNNKTPNNYSINLGAGTSEEVNASGRNYVGYLWAEVPGFSRFHWYKGNGSQDGPFLNCGFRPKFLMIKRIDASRNWYIYDSARNPFNGSSSLEQVPNDAVVDTASTSGGFDFVSNGVKIRTNWSNYNESTANYIFVAFAENPFKYANAR